jgi:hypothetical protein
MAHAKTQIQTLTYGYQDFLDPDVFQIIMSNLFQDKEYVETINYLDCLTIPTNISFKYYLPKLLMVLVRLSTAVLKMNVLISLNPSSLQNK